MNARDHGSIRDERELWDLMRPDMPRLPGDTPFDVLAFASLRRRLVQHPLLVAVSLAVAVTWGLLAGLMPQ
jgi:hypothetical protein